MAGVATASNAVGRPQAPVSDPFRRDGSDPAWNVFGTKRLPTNVPTNLPLPAKANPANLFKIESPGPRVVKGAMAVAGATILFVCAIDEIWNTFSSDCDQRPRAEIKPPVAPKPTINR